MWPEMGARFKTTLILYLRSTRAAKVYVGVPAPKFVNPPPANSHPPAAIFVIVLDRNSEVGFSRRMKGFAMRTALTVFVLSVLLTGCNSRPPLRSASLANAASAAQKKGDWASAAQLWEQAIQKENGFWKPEYSPSPKIIAIYNYELGRSLGVLGQCENAEKHLLEALRLDEQFDGPKGMDLVELARLNHACGNNARAISFFGQVLPRMDEVAEADPAAYLALLQEAASVYQTVGQTNRAADLNAKAQKFSARHPDAKFTDDYGWTPYKSAAR